MGNNSILVIARGSDDGWQHISYCRDDHGWQHTSYCRQDDGYAAQTINDILDCAAFELGGVPARANV